MKKIFCLFVLCCAAVVTATEFSVKSGVWRGTVDSKGAVLKALSFKGKPMTIPGYGGFTDFVMGNGGEKVELCEDFFKLNFEPLLVHPDRMVFSACGVGAFAGLRVTKTYIFHSRKPEFTVTWEYKNIGNKTVSAGLRTRCFFRNTQDRSNTILFPRTGKMVKADYPGALLQDQWVTDPGLAVTAVHGKSDPAGMILLPPASLLGAVYCYFSQREVLNTQEFFLNDQPIEPGKSITFSVKIKASANVPAELAKLKPESLKIGAMKGQKLRMPLIYTVDKKAVQISYGSRASTEKHLDLVPERQLNESYRTLELPANCDGSALSLYEMANKAPMLDRPVAFRLFKDAKGKTILKFRVPGVRPGFGGGVEWRGNCAYESSGRRWFLAQAKYPCRLLFRKGGVIDNTIPEGDADLVYNGDFSKADPKDGTIPEGYRSQFNWNRHIHLLNIIFKKPGLRLSWYKDSKRTYPVFGFPVRLERGVQYTLEMKLGTSNPLGHWTLAAISFFDKDNKPLNRSKDVRLFCEKKSMPMKLRSKSFFPPEGAVRGEFALRVYDKEQTVDLVSLALKPEPFRSEVRTPEQILRNELKSGFIPGLELIEKLEFTHVSPHRKYFCNPASPLPRVLYLFGNANSCGVKSAERRHLIELLQRAKFDYTYLPLLRKVDSARNNWNFNYANTLEPYTLLKLRSLKGKYDAVMLNNVDFTYIPKETVEQLKKFRKNGTSLIFYNCRKMPKELLGKSMAVPENILGSLPQMRTISARDLRRNLQFYTDGKTPTVVWNTGSFETWNVRNLPFVPADKADELVHNLYGQEFPYWEYFYLAQLKALRSAAHKEGSIVVQKAAPDGLTVASKSACKVKVSAVVRDLYGRFVAQAETQADLKAGLNTVVSPVKPDAGGISVVDFMLTDLSGRELDCGAYKVENPALPLKVTMKQPDLVFARKAPVSFTLESVPGAVFDCEIVDSEKRSVWKKSGKETSFSVPLSFPYTRLYNLYVRAQANGKSALVQQEFALESAPLDPFDVNAAIWMSRPAYNRLVRELGFNMDYTGFQLASVKCGMIRAMVTGGCEPVPCGCGGVLNRTQRVYRGDVKTDPVRKPCFSDPVRAGNVDKELADTLNGFRARYYGVRCYILADEASLGSTVCFSEHCLKAFRKWLKPRYASLAELNKAWGTAFNSWDEVVPVQFKELKDKERMAQYIEHKLFMNLVFARNWAGSVLEGLRKAAPGAVSGLSGTQDPGISYDWVQMMKYNPFLMYYGGNQVNAVLDFAPAGSLHGQWLGYTRGFKRNEVTNKGRIWLDLFRGANLICKYSCETFCGDITATPNAYYFSEAVREIRSGAGARILRSRELGRDIGVLYSQSSLLCAISNQVGNQNILNMWSSWPALLTDLGLRYKMISYEELETSVPNFKVIVLPGAFSLSKNQIANLKKFAENGGTVIADCGPGWYDGHGNKADFRDAEELFGISRNQAKLYPADAPQYTTMPLGETGLKLAGSKAQKMISGEPVAITKEHGKGKTVLLNLGIGSYQSTKLGGVGGEDVSVVSGKDSVQKALRDLVSPLLAQCKAPFKVEGMTGATIFLRQDGTNYLAGILPVIVDVPRYSDLKRQTVTLTFPVKGHLYLSRSGKYLGYGNSCKIAVRSGDPELIAILPEKIGKVEISAPEKLSPGAVCNFKVKVSGGKEKHVLHVEVRRPDGTLPFGYAWNSYAPCSGTKFKFQFARNDAKGTWQIVVRDIDSGTTEIHKIELR